MATNHSFVFKEYVTKTGAKPLWVDYDYKKMSVTTNIYTKKNLEITDQHDVNQIYNLLFGLKSEEVLMKWFEDHSHLYGNLRLYTKEVPPMVHVPMDDAINANAVATMPTNKEKSLTVALNDAYGESANDIIKMGIQSSPIFASAISFADGLVADTHTLVNEYPKTDTQAHEQRPEVIIQRLIDFFSEFNFVPGIRFTNTLRRNCVSISEAERYVTNYMSLCDSPYVNDIKEKMKSAEFTQIITDLATIPCTKEINQRLELHFGPQGTGKTVTVQTAYPDAPVIICNSSIFPADLMEVFDFKDKDGTPVFKKSELRLAMEEGRPIIFEEINLLSLDCLRALQGYLDNKNEISYKNETIKIKAGFKVIGTMNLEVNNQIFGLPTPFVDRAYTLKNYDSNSELLLKVAF